MTTVKTIKILVLFYSLTGTTAKLAEAVAEGARRVVDTEVEIKQIPELLSKELIESKPHLKKAREELNARYAMATLDDLLNADGVAMGTPTHFGSFASQVKQFLDQLTPVWLQGKTVNKPVAVFCTAGSMHGGEEVALISLMIPLLNLGMIPIGIPYPIQGEGPDFDAGSPYGAIYVTGHHGERELSEADKKVAGVLGMRLATMTHILQCGCEACGMCQVLTEKIE